MMVKGASVFGIAFLIVGILGFVPPLAPQRLLFGLFEVGPVHNVVHLVSGALGVLAALAGAAASLLYLRAVGIVYGLVTVAGFFYLDAPLLGVMAHNPADIGLHLLITLIALYLGFVAPRTPSEPAPIG